jgi:hypothetical protein
MKRLLWFTIFLIALPATAQPRGGPLNSQPVRIDNCVVTTGACPANGYVCVQASTKAIYQCLVSSGWRQVSVGGASNTPTAGQCATWDAVNSTVMWDDCGTGGGGSGTSTIQEGGADVSTAADTLNFGLGFDLTEPSSGTVNVVLDYSEDPIGLATSDVSGRLPVASGGTGGADATTARSNLSAAKSGANSDITSITGLVTMLSTAQGGLGLNSSASLADSYLVTTAANTWAYKVFPNCDATGSQLGYDPTTHAFECAADGAGGSGIEASEEGSDVTAAARSRINFTGAAFVTAADDAVNSRVNVTFSASPDSASVVGTGRTLTGGAGLAAIGDLSSDRTLATASQEALFLADGGASSLTCGSSNQGKTQVMDNGVLQYCDGATTSVLKYAATADSSGNASTGASGTGFFQAGAVDVNRGGTGVTSIGTAGQVLFNDAGLVGYDETGSMFSYNKTTDALTVGSIITSGATDNNRYLEMQGNSADVGIPASGYFRLYASGTAGSEALKYYTATGGIKTTATLTGTETLTNKTFAGASNDLSVRIHATDCTGLTDGVSGELCYEQDADTIYACEPTAGACDTAGEWRATSSAGSGDITDVWNCSTGDCSALTAAAADTLDANAMTGSNAFRLPYQAANTVSAAGAATLDSSADQFVYYGAASRTLHYIQSTCAVLESVVDTDDSYEFWEAPYAVTVTGVSCRCRGACSTLATFTLEDRGGNAMTITGTNPTCATTGNSTYAAVTAANALVAGEGIAFDVTNAPTTNTAYTICVTYTVDRQ